MSATNPTQKRILVTGGLVLSAMFLFPPWIYIYRHEHTAPTLRPAETGPVVHDRIERAAGYALIFRPPAASASTPMFPKDIDVNFVSTRIDIARLAIQSIGTALLIAVLSIGVSDRCDHVRDEHA